jgi:hypothetical protein
MTHYSTGIKYLMHTLDMYLTGSSKEQKEISTVEQVLYIEINTLTRT